MTAFYNEIDSFAADWIQNLSQANLIAPGRVDRRSIADVRPDDLVGHVQAHFFAGIAGWSYALRLAGWPDDEPIWTGSCPCQPFSVAGNGRGEADERHLWPELKRLIGECRPRLVCGEQVASADGRAWLATVRTDLEDMDYAVWAADLCAAGVGAPHIRQRIYWLAERVADPHGVSGGEGRSVHGGGHSRGGLEPRPGPGHLCGVGGMGHSDGAPSGRVAGASGSAQATSRRGWLADGAGGDSTGAPDPDDHGRVGYADRHGLSGLGKPRLGEGVGLAGPQPARAGADGSGVACPVRDRYQGGEPTGPSSRGRRSTDSFGARGLGNPHDPRLEERPLAVDQRGVVRDEGSAFGSAGDLRGPWGEPEWLPCSDGKSRPTQRGLFPLAPGLPRGLGVTEPDVRRAAEVAGLDGRSLKHAKANRIGQLRGYGNAVNAQLAATFIRAYMESR